MNQPKECSATLFLPFLAENCEERRKNYQRESTERDEKTESGRKKDIQSRTNNLRKGRQGLGGGGRSKTMVCPVA
jgi:hypothetical protein